MDSAEHKIGSPEDTRLFGLLLDAAAGSSAAFETLVNDYSPMLEAAVAVYADRLPPQDLEELRQEALLAFYRAVRRFDPLYGNVSFGLYAKVCVRNGVASAVRSILSSDSRTVLPFDGTEAEDLSDPQQEIIEREKADELRRLIRSLLSDYENTVWWSYYSGIPVAAIAAQMGKTPRSVENALSRIRRKLKQALR